MTDVGTYQIHTEARGPHWIAWLTRGDAAKPDRGVILVAETRDAAESRARDWIAHLNAIAPSGAPP